jgi:enoyl-CoA hydratase
MAADFSVTREDGGVAVLTLERPSKRNALSIAMRFGLADALTDLAADDTVGCLLLTGAGSAFCAGMDTGEFGGDFDHRRRIVESSIAAFGALGEFPRPALAAVNGPAVAGGFALALLCDIRVASTSARLGFGALPPGVPPSYAAARAALTPALARELSLTRRVLHSGEAADLGVVSELVEPVALMPRALELARSCADAAGLETKRRILLERRLLHGRLFDDEAWALRKALLQ